MVVYFPPNLVGLNISDCTVAIAKSLVSFDVRFVDLYDHTPELWPYNKPLLCCFRGLRQ